MELFCSYPQKVRGKDNTPKYIQVYASAGLIVSAGFWSLPTALVKSGPVSQTLTDLPREVDYASVCHSFNICAGEMKTSTKATEDFLNFTREARN